MAAGELAVRVQVDGEPLAGVEQLDQEPRIGPEAGGVLGTQVGLGIGPDRVAQEAAVREAREPILVLAEERGRRADPVLGPPVAWHGVAAKGGDRRPALVEAGRLVGSEQDRPHGGAV